LDKQESAKQNIGRKTDKPQNWGLPANDVLQKTGNQVCSQSSQRTKHVSFSRTQTRGRGDLFDDRDIRV